MMSMRWRECMPIGGMQHDAMKRRSEGNAETRYEKNENGNETIRRRRDYFSPGVMKRPFIHSSIAATSGRSRALRS